MDGKLLMPQVSAVGDGLSPRELDVVELLSLGLSNRDIATELSLTEHTVKNYLFRVFDKLGLDNRVKVARWYILNDIKSR